MAPVDEKAVKAGNAGEKKQSSFVMDEEFEKIINTVVPTEDDQSLPSLTLRAWVLGILFMALLAFVNTLFLFRTNYFSVSSYMAVILSYPLGRIWAAIVPSVKFSLPLIGEVDTNPGPFTVKEHVLVGIFASTGAAGIYGIDNLGIQKIFFEFDIPAVAAIFFLIATSTLGFGFSGMARKFLVRPAHMIWPTILPQVGMYTAFHQVHVEADDEAKSKRHMSRMKVFMIAFFAMALWQFVPGWIAPMLVNLPIVCWIAPKDSAFQLWGSPTQGVGLGSLTLDWTTAGVGNMIMPYWSSVNFFIANVVFAWIIAPIAFTGKWWNTPKDVKLNVTRIYSREGKRMGPRDLCDPVTNLLDEAKYQAAAPIYMSPFFALSYWSSMSTFTAALSQCIFWFGRDIWSRFSAARNDDDEHDIHCQLIDKYPEVPQWWYYFSFVASMVITTVVFQTTQMYLPWWATGLAVLISVVAVLPFGIVLATAGVGLYMNVISEFIIGLINPGDPIGMAAFKALSVLVTNQCLTLLADLKLGHYLKINPRHIFVVQMSAQVMAAIVSYWAFEGFANDPTHKEWVVMQGEVTGVGAQWGGAVFNTFFNASLIWGAIAPKRYFFESSYAPVIYSGLAIGFVGPIITKLADKFLGSKIVDWKLVSPVILFNVSGPPSNQSFILTGFLIATTTMFYMYRYHSGSWKRYNYVIAAAFDAGAALATIIAMLGLVDNGVTFPNWFLNPSEAMLKENPELFGTNGDWCNVVW